MTESPAAPGGSTGIDGVVELNVPAGSAFVAVLRSVTAGLAARCELTLDEIEDLRIAVDEACALLLPLAADGTDLHTTFTLAHGEMVVRAGLATRTGAQLNRDGFGWTVLRALASAVEVDDSPGRMVITLTKRREPASR